MCAHVAVIDILVRNSSTAELGGLLSSEVSPIQWDFAARTAATQHR